MSFLRRVCAAVAVCGVIATALAPVPAPASAQDRSLRITSFDADLTVMTSGTLAVTERITAEFTGSWNGLYRSIPVRYSMDSGEDYTVRLDVTSVKDERGNDLRTETEREGAYLKIKAWIPGATDATHTLILSYTVDKALRFFDEHDELYWNVTGNAWEYPLESVTTRIFLPTGASGRRTTAFTGVTGARGGAAAVDTTTGITTVRTTAPLGLREGLTVVHGWDPGLVNRPSSADRALSAFLSNAVLAIPLIVLLLMLSLWRRHGRDPALGSIAPRYDPPAGMSPAEAGTLIDLSVDTRDIAATLVDLAVRGHLRIHQLESSGFLGIKSTEYRFDRITTSVEWAPLKAHERQMLEGLFPADEDAVTVASLKDSFYKTVAEMQSSLSSTLTRDGHYRRHPSVTRVAFVAAGVVVGFGLGSTAGWLETSWGVSVDMVMIAALGSALIIAAFGWFMPARTIRGTNALRDVLGFEEFLGRVEGERMKRVIDRPELFEKYLPYAISFNVADAWASAFAGIITTAPGWYSGPHGSVFHTHAFMSDMDRMTTSATAAMTSAPRSSGGSGFSGGSSGGGFGGGGGGGF